MASNKSIEERIAEQLDLLASPDLNDSQIERIQGKIGFLQSLKEGK